jgi:hypothetical protein
MHPVNIDDATMVVWSMLSESGIIHRLPETVAIGRFLPVGAESLVTFLSIAHTMGVVEKQKGLCRASHCSSTLLCMWME